MASSSSVLGRMPASDSGVALTRTMNLIVITSFVNGIGCSVAERGLVPPCASNETPPDRHAGAGRGSSAYSTHLRNLAARLWPRPRRPDGAAVGPTAHDRRPRRQPERRAPAAAA